MAYGITAQIMVGRVKAMKPTASPQWILQILNDRFRAVFDYKGTWADLLKRGVISIPAGFNTGTVSLNPGSNIVIGDGTFAWPVNDLVNTTTTQPVSGSGYQQVSLASALGVTPDTFLVFDVGTPSQETVAVISVTAANIVNPAGIITAKFQVAHKNGCVVQASSLNGLQLNLGSTPIFTVQAVYNPTTLQIDNPWGNAAITQQTYQILKMYVSLGPDVREIAARPHPTPSQRLSGGSRTQWWM